MITSEPGEVKTDAATQHITTNTKEISDVGMENSTNDKLESRNVKQNTSSQSDVLSNDRSLHSKTYVETLVHHNML